MSREPTRTGSGLHRALDRSLRYLELGALAIAAVFMLATMLLVSFDALLRYMFNAPLLFQYTLTEDYLLVGLVCLSLSWGYRTGGYIRINGVATLLPPRLAEWIVRAGLLFSAGYVATLGWKGGEEFVKSYISGEAKIGAVAWPVWASWIWIPVGLGLLTLRLLLAAFGPAEDLDHEHEPAEEI